jgi:multiple sugar transport system permease protein
LALVVIILYSVWTYAGYSAVIFLAGLGTIPGDVYEAARIDGANGWQQFRHITLPLLSPTTFFLMLIATIGTFQAFTQIFLMRRPGAFDAVDTINLYIYDEITRSSPDYAYGSAMAFVLFAVILTLTLIQNRIVGRKVFYG